MKRIEMLVIDPQVSFCDPNGELFVKGADKDMSRVATMINRLRDKISMIHVTLDSHHLFDIAHPIFWRDSNNNHPAPFTIISNADVVQGKWMPTRPSLFKYVCDYTAKLEAGKRYPLCIWPPHCLIGSKGHCVVPELFEAIKEWEAAHINICDYVTKGSNWKTEHYSAVKAEVPDPSDPSTQINTGLINTLETADIIAVMGEAGSHCLANSLRDVVANFGDSDNAKKFVLLTDGFSPVGGFEKLQEDFIKDMVAMGMQLSTTVDFLS